MLNLIIALLVMAFFACVALCICLLGAGRRLKTLSSKVQTLSIMVTDSCYEDYILRQCREVKNEKD